MAIKRLPLETFRDENQAGNTRHRGTVLAGAAGNAEDDRAAKEKPQCRVRNSAARQNGDPCPKSTARTPFRIDIAPNDIGCLDVTSEARGISNLYVPPCFTLRASAAFLPIVAVLREQSKHGKPKNKGADSYFSFLSAPCFRNSASLWHNCLQRYDDEENEQVQLQWMQHRAKETASFPQPTIDTSKHHALLSPLEEASIRSNNDGHGLVDVCASLGRMLCSARVYRRVACFFMSCKSSNSYLPSLSRLHSTAS